MNNSTALSRTAGRVGSLLALVAVFAFMIGIFGGPRELAFAGVAMFVASFVAFFIEEQGSRKSTT